MNSRLSTAALLLVSTLAICGRALADCPLGSAYDAGKALERGQALEAQGKKEEALSEYVKAQAEVCDPVNPYRAPAAKRGAPLGLELGTAAEKRGDLWNARSFYEMGSHWVRADQIVVQIARADRDNPSEYVNAHTHFERRAELAANSKSYSPDPRLVAEVNAMPKQAIDRFWKTEQGAFNEQFLADFVKLSRIMVSDPTDMVAAQRAGAEQNAFMQKWKQDLMQVSQDSLDKMQRWAKVSGDAALEKSTLALANQRADQHAQILVQKYYGSPALFETAIKFVPLTGAEESKRSARIAGIKAQAVKLGDEENAKQNYLLAIGYYKAGGDDAKAKATQDKLSQLVAQKMKPGIAQAQKQAEALKQQFSDPKQIEAMKAQAEAAKKAVQQQQAANAKSADARKQGTDDLEKELGL
jgi:hypothetical protein